MPSSSNVSSTASSSARPRFALDHAQEAFYNGALEPLSKHHLAAFAKHLCEANLVTEVAHRTLALDPEVDLASLRKCIALYAQDLTISADDIRNANPYGTNIRRIRRNSS
jgi:hypothetical protein